MPFAGLHLAASKCAKISGARSSFLPFRASECARYKVKFKFDLRVGVGEGNSLLISQRTSLGIKRLKRSAAPRRWCARIKGELCSVFAFFMKLTLKLFQPLVLLRH
jgi:hypothetical protein